MKKFIVFAAAALMVLGAGCSSSTPSLDTNIDTSVSPNTSVQPTGMTSSSDDMSYMDMSNMDMSDTATTSPSTSTLPNPDIAHATIPSATTSTTNTKTYTMADVQAASTAKKCWAVINGKVYDLTTWISKHPGGPDKILKLCGTDGSTFFNNQHGGQPQPEKALASFQIGVLKK